MCKVALLRPRRDNSERLTLFSLPAEGLYESAILLCRTLPRTIHIVEVGNGVWELIPAAVVHYKLSVGGLAPRIRGLHSTQPAIAKLGRGAGVDQFAPALAPKLHYAKGAVFVEVPHHCGLRERYLHARVLSAVVDEVRCFGDMFFDILGMPFAILDALHMVFPRAGKVIVERYNLVALFGEPPAQGRADKPP